MSADIYITSSCSINNGVILKNGCPVYKNEEKDISTLLITAYHHFDIKYPKFYKMDNLSKLGWLATEILLKNSFNTEKYAPVEVAVILSNANSSLDTDIKYYETTKDIASPAQFVYTLPNIVMGEICIRHNFKGENAFFVFEKFDADFIEQYVRLLFNNNNLQACICGWVELTEDKYKTVLFLVEKEKGETPVLFTKENIYKTYTSKNG